MMNNFRSSLKIDYHGRRSEFEAVCIHPGAKVRVITREARYYAKTRAFASFYAIISRAHAARAVT